MKRAFLSSFPSSCFFPSMYSVSLLPHFDSIRYHIFDFDANEGTGRNRSILHVFLTSELLGDEEGLFRFLTSNVSPLNWLLNLSGPPTAQVLSATLLCSQYLHSSNFHLDGID